MKGKKFKKLISLLLALIMLLTVVPATVSAAAAEEVTVLTAKISEALETGGKNLFTSASEAVQQAGEKLKSVMNLSSNSDFEYRVLEDGTAEITKYKGKATDLVIPSEIDGYKVTSIGVRAFSYCSSLTSITIPDSVTRIGNYAFYDCYALTSIVISNSVTSIGNSAFEMCKSLTNITIPDSVISIGDVAFSWCTSLTDIKIPDSVTSIGASAFSECSSLTNVTIPNGVETIKGGTFFSCSSLIDITIPNSVVSLGIQAFAHCSSLTSITIPDSVKTIENSAFYYCESLADVKIPDSVTDMGEHVFAGCKSLTNVTLSSNITRIKEGSFEECESLTSITIPDGVTGIGFEAFKECDALVNVTMTDSVTGIGGYAFYGCGLMENINLSANLTSIEYSAFEYCRSIKNLEIPNSVTGIGNRAFSSCSSLANITIPYSVTFIGISAFSGCESLTDITIPNSVISMGDSAFSGCSLLTSITIPSSVTYIGVPAFDYCKSLKEIKVSAENANYCDIDGVLYNKDKTEIIQYPEGKKEKNYNIPNSVTDIKESAFSGCDVLENIVIPVGVKLIEKNAFKECASLASVTLPESVTEIGYGAFEDCISLESIVLPDRMSSMESMVFHDCVSLTSITIPDGIEKIAGGMLEGCTSLKSVTIPKGIRKIGDGAFTYCSSLTDVYYSGTKQQWNKIEVERFNIDLLNATLHCASGVYAGSLNKGSVGFTVFDKSYFIESQRGDVNKTLKDVTVTAGNYEEKFNDFLIVDDIPKDASVTFTKDGYNKYIIPSQVAKALFSSDKGQQFNVYMTKSPGDGKPYVSTVFVKNSDEEAYTEVQMSSAVASKGNKYDIVMSAGNVSGDATYYLSQDSNHRISSKTGAFSAVDIVSKFTPGQDIYAYVQNGSKTSEPVKLKLNATNISGYDDSISLIGKDGFKIKASDNIPLIGGAEISLDGFKFPLGMEVEGNRVRISFGIDVFSTEYEDEDGWKIDNPWELLKKSVSSIEKEVDDSTEKLKEYKKLYKKLKGKKFVPEDKSKFNFDVSMLGYAEGYIVGNRIEFTETCGEIAGKFSFTFTYQGALSAVPYYVYVKAAGEMGVGFGLMRHLPDSNIPFDFGMNLKFTPSITVGGGLGIKGAVSAGFYGKGSLPLELNFSKRHGSVDISGEIGVEASLVGFNPKFILLDDTIHVWDGYWGTKKEASLAKLNAVTEKLREENEEKTETTVMSRDYLQYTSDWKGGNIFTRLFSSRAVSEGMEIKDLQTSVYNNSETQLVSLDDGRMMMAWIEDDADRDEYNRLRLMYSVWENGVWSKPKAVSDSGTTDSTPSLATDGKNVYIAWQNVNYKMSQADADPIAKVLEKTEIKFAQYDSEKDEFVNVKTLTDNSGYDYTPTAAAENGECVVYWLSNSGNDLTVENSNTLYKYSLSSGKTDTVKSDMNNILGIDAIVKGGESEVSYAMDTDGNLATTEDIKAFTLKNGEQVQLSPENEEMKNADFAVAYGKLNGNDTVFFADNSNIYYRENGEVKSIFTSIRSINGDLQVLDNAEETTLMWSEITEAGTDLWVCSYSNGEWNEPVQVTDTGKLLHNISAVYHDGAIRGVLNRTDRLIKDGEYVNGATDLCAMTLSDFTELEAEFVAVDESQFVKGKETELSVYLKNNGTKDIEKVKITLSDTLSTDITVEETVNLKSGEEKLVTVKYPVPENYGRTDLTVKAVVPGEEEIDENDNEDTVSVGFADISISDMKVEDVGCFYILTAILSNDNQTTAENVKVEVREGSKDGNVVDTVEVGNLEPGTVKSIQYIVDKTAVDYDGEKLGHIYFVATIEEPAVQSRAAKTEPTEKITEDNFVGAVFEYTAPETEPEPETKPGDINGDGQVTAVDARWVLQIAAGTREVTEAERKLADLNGDDEITAVDARWVLQIAAGTRVA